MAKSLKKIVTDVQDLVAIAGLTAQQTYSIHIGHEGVRIHLPILELVRVSKLLNVSRGQIKVDTTPKAAHISFKTRGATWMAVLMSDRVEEFCRLMGVDPEKLTSAKSTAIEGTQQKALPQLF